MKKYLCYLADALTFLRILLAGFLAWWAFAGHSVGVGLAVFCLAELTDAFDGYCSRRWPYEAGKEPWFKKYAVKYDMFADAFLWFAMALFFTLLVNFWAGLILFEVTILLCGAIEIIVYGKLFGHPDDCLKFSLCRRNFKLAKKLVMGRRWFYLATIVLMAVWSLVAAEWPLGVKIGFGIVGAAICVFLWFFLETRRKNISRNAIKLEKDMLKDADAKENESRKSGKAAKKATSKKSRK